MKFSYHLGVPLLASQMSRSSLVEARDHLELTSPVWYKKELGERIGDGPWLVVMNRASCRLTELEIWTRVDSLTSSKGLDYGIITSSDLFKYQSSALIDPVWIKEETLGSVGGIWFSTEERIELKETFTEVLAPRPTEGDYTFSCWFWNPQHVRTETAVILERIDSEGNTSWDAFESIDRSYAYSGDSTRFELNMQIRDSQSSYRILLKQPDRSPKEVRVNHFLFTPISQKVYRKVGDKISINNHIFVDSTEANDSLNFESATFGAKDD
jgi:hypothetical protein